MSRYLLVVLAGMTGALLTAPALAQRPELIAKSAWRWTSDERAAARLDRPARARRVTEYRNELVRRGGAGNPQPFIGCDDVLDGNVHPELFFVTELFPALVTSSFVTLPRVYPLVVRKGAPDVFRTDEDWERFRSIAAPYAKLIARERDLVTRKSTEPANAARIERELVSVRAQREAAMVRALRESRAAFGRDPFDRMLYTVVAKGRVICTPDTDGDGGRSDVRIAKEREDRSQ